MTTISNFLKSENARLVYEDKWMVWDEFLHEWLVLQRKYGARRNITLYRGASLTNAVEKLY